MWCSMKMTSLTSTTSKQFDSITMDIRLENAEDIDGIRELTRAAFKDMPFSDQTEAGIIDALRADNALTLSLVAIEERTLVGHVAFSPVTINGETIDWYGLGPVSVWPLHQRRGIGKALIQDGIQRLKDIGANGCVLLGDPRYYSRFGFECDPGLTYSPAPAAFFQRLVFVPPAPKGEVSYHAAFQ